MTRRLRAGVFLFALAAILRAQQPDETLPGFKSNNIYDSSGIDNVNLFSGDPGVVIPIGPVYTLGPGYTWQLKAHNTCKFWNLVGITCPGFSGINYALVSGASTLGIGWRLDLGYVTALIPSPTAANYTSPDGGTRGLYLTGTAITDDGTHLRGSSHPCPPGSNPPGSTCYAVEFPDGSKQLFDHLYVPGKPTAGTSPDFDGATWDPHSIRAGLTSITDRFGTTLLKVEYVDNCLATPCTSPSAWQVHQIDLYGDSTRAIVFNWISLPIAQGPTWTVLNQLSFPSTSPSVPPLTVTFSYTGSSFPRNVFDNSAGTGCGPTGGASVFVPYLSSVSFKGGASTLAGYGFGYFQSGQPQDPNGSLTDITLPTNGTIHYDYGVTASYCIATACPDPESTTNGTSMQTRLQQLQVAAPQQYTDSSYLDVTNAVIKRTATDAAGLSSAVTYNRRNFFQFTASPPNVDLSRILRRTVVTEPVGKGPPPNFDDTAQKATVYIFHVAPPGESSDPGFASGFELERRYFSDTGTGLIRSAVNCWDGNSGGGTTCGAKNTSTGGYQQYLLSGDLRQQAAITWYGANSLGGGACSGGGTPCVSHVNSGYDINARQYQTAAVSSASLPNGGGPSHTTFTHWTPWIDSTHWLLGLYDEKNDLEGSTTIYRGYEFDSGAAGGNGITATPGFLRGVISNHLPYDPNNRMLLLECNYPDATANFGKEFSATYLASDLPPPAGSAGITSKPYSNLCSAAYTQYPTPPVGTNNDAFGHVYNWSHGLLNSGKWVNGGTTGNPTTFSWLDFNAARDSAVGLITTSYDTSLVSTTYSYDAVGRITQISPIGENPTFICYDTTTRTTVYRAPSAVSCPTGGASGSIQTWQQYLYDGLGRLTREIRALPGAGGAGFAYAVRAHTYDTAGHRFFDSEWKSCTNPASDCLSATPGGTTNANFDPFGRAQITIRADGSATTIDYTDGSILSSDTQKAVTVNNINGSCSGTCQNGISATTTYVYDSYGRLTKVTEPSNDITTYAYDANGKLTNVTQGSQARAFTYDHFGFLRSEFTPEKGTVNYNTIGSLGNVAQRTENDGTVLSTIYDAAGRLSCTGQGVIVMSAGTCANAWSTPTQYVQNFYDGNGFPGGTYPLGKLTRRIGSNPLTSPFPTARDDFSYSALGGRLSQLSTTITGGILGSVNQTWAYNNLGLVTQHSHARPSGNSLPPLVESTTYTAGVPVAVYANGMPAVTSVDYAPSGALNHYTTGLFSGKTVTTTIGFDTTTLMPRPTQVSTAGASINFNTGSYTYDGVGNIAFTGADAFLYDNRSRLISTSLSGVGSQSYTYDRYGNLLTKGGTTFCSGSCTNNRITGYTYDSRGNLLSSLAESYTYDPLDRTKTSTVSNLTSKYLYDGASERVVKIDSSNNWTYTLRDEASRVSTEFAGSSQSRDNIFLGHQVVGSYANGSVQSNGPVWSFYSSDHLGTPRLVTDVAATQVEARRYWPFGDQVVAAQPFQHIRFAAMEQDTEAGPGNDRYNDHARHHGAGLGRFLTVDLRSGNPLDPQTWNRYAYSRDNPVKFLDIDGNATAPAQAVGEFLMAGAEAAVSSIDPNHERFAGQNLLTLIGAAIANRAGDDLTAGTDTGLAIGAGENPTEAIDADLDRLGEIGAVLSLVGGVISEAIAARDSAAAVKPYDRRLHFGDTPTRADRTALGAGPDQVVNHDPPLVMRYYDGDPSKGEKPGKVMTPAERYASARDRSRMNLQSKRDSCAQGADCARYARSKRLQLEKK